MLRLTQFRVAFALACWILPLCAPLLTASDPPAPGSIYREFCRHSNGNLEWRVTDDRAVEKFDRAAHFLPNPRLEFEIADLEHAVRAEALLDRWGGHRGTINKRIRFNDHDWIGVPELTNVPEGLRPDSLMYQDNPVIEVPLSDLREGINVFDADCDEEGGFGWGQWGIFALVLRIYYDSELKGSELGFDATISSPSSGDTVTENPEITVDASSEAGIARVDLIAAYDGYDVDGDGNFNEWHKSRFQLVRGQPNELRNHVATLWGKPYRAQWDTYWIPDQRPGAVSLVARVQDSRGYWYVTDIVKDLSLLRPDVTVQLYPARGMAEDHGVRDGETKDCFFDLPNDIDVEAIEDAVIHLRTWHGWDGHHEPLLINEHAMPIEGKNHFYDYDLLEIPPAALRPGENRFRIRSETEHHQLELLWPGPALSTRARKPEVTIKQGRYQDREHFVVETRQAVYWIDKNSGGISRLIDADGKDWIAFKKEPWGDYPAAAASAFRGIPNLVHGRSESGFGHPGWDVATSRQVDHDTILVNSNQGKWQLRWDFTADEAKLTVEKTDGDTPYWFLYEGPIAGRWAPHEQYFATNTNSPIKTPHDYFKGDKLFEQWKWAYFGDVTTPRVLFILHEQSDDAADTFSHLGNTESGLASDDGMVVFGFGRGPNGIEPLLQGMNSFRIGFVEERGDDASSYMNLKARLDNLPQ